MIVPSAANAAAGSLDPSFGGDGKVTTDFGIDAGAFAIAIQPNARIVAAGNLGFFAGSDFALARYFSDNGRLDGYFGGDGKVTTDFGGYEIANAVAVWLDGSFNGRVIAAGFTSVGANGSDDFALARYRPNGNLDLSFGGDGKVTTDFGGDDSAEAIAIQSNGKIVAAGVTRPPGECHSAFALARYNPNGDLDKSFGGDGTVTTRFENTRCDWANAVAIQGNGKIVAGGVSVVERNDGNFTDVTDDFALARYNYNGTLDPTFGGDGTVTTDRGLGNGDELIEAIVLRDGKVVVAGSAGFIGENDFAMARYTYEGNLDPSFGGGKIVLTSFRDPTRCTSEAFGVVVQSNGRIVAGGKAATCEEGSNDFALARYLSNGSLDSTFDGDGKVTTDFGGPPGRDDDWAFGLALQTDGKVVAAGRTGGTFALARYKTV